MRIRLPHIRQPRHRKQLLAVMLVAVIGMTFALPAFANWQDSIFLMLSTIVAAMIKLFASLTGTFISIMVAVARYNTFLNAPIVEQGWPIVRDLMNMVFIIALLIISAGTVLRLQNYRYNRLLGKLIIMAFLVNFSKFIAVFLLQFAQIVMLTFVNAFRDVAFANFTHMFGMDAVLNFARADAKNTGFFTNDTNNTGISVFVTLVAGLAMMLIAFVVTMSITVVLFVRIIALWLLIILSPIAYALRVIPNTEKYASQWWSEFGKYAVVGPVMAFFLWIALALVNSGSSCTTSDITQDCQSNPIAAADKSPDQSVISSLNAAKDDTADLRNDFISEALSIDRLITFVVGIIFLMMGLNYAQRSGGAGGAWAGKVATAGFGVAATVSGLNAIRDRTIAPVQGYLKERDRRRQAANARRTVGFTKLADQVESRTLGNVERPLEAAKRSIGGTVSSIGKSAWKGAVPTAKSALKGINDVRTGAKSGVDMLNDVKDFAVKDVGGALVDSVKTGGGAFKTGWRQGTEGERIRRMEIQKAKSSKDKFEQEIGRYGDMDPEARRRAAEHGSASEKYAAGLIMGRKNEIDFKDDKDLAVAQDLGKIFLDVANSAEELERSLTGFSPEMRQAMFGGMDVGAFRGGKRDMLAEIGFIKEAYTQKKIGGAVSYDETKASTFVKRNEAQIVDQMKKGQLSYASAEEEKIMKSVHELGKVDKDVVADANKNLNFSKHYAIGMSKLTEAENAKDDFDLTKEEGRNRKFFRDAYQVGAAGGVVKDHHGKEINVMDSARVGVTGARNIAAMDEQQKGLIRSDGGKLHRFNLRDSRTSQDAKERIIDVLDNRHVSTWVDKNPQTADDIMRVRRHWAASTGHTVPGATAGTAPTIFAAPRKGSKRQEDAESSVERAKNSDVLNNLGK